MVECAERFIWDVPTDKEIEEQLRETDAETLQDRISRFRFLVGEFGPAVDMLMLGGLPAVVSYREIFGAFLNGLDLSVILSAHIFLEQTLGGHLIMCGYNDIAESSFSAIVEKYVEIEALDNSVAQQIHALRKMRIAYFHSHVGLKQRSYMKRLIDKKGGCPFELLYQDAQFAIKVVVNVMRHQNPKWNPEFFKNEQGN